MNDSKDPNDLPVPDQIITAAAGAGTAAVVLFVLLIVAFGCVLVSSLFYGG